MNERPTDQVNVNTQRRPAWLLPAAAIALIATAALVLALLAPRGDRSAATPQTSPSASATPSPSAPATATSTASPPAAASPTSPASSPGAGTSDRLGLAVRGEGVLPPLVVRSENSPQAVDRLERVVSSAVSPDGRQIAAWLVDAQEVPRRLVTLTVGSGAAPTTILELPANERGGGVAWSADGRGLHLGVQSASTVPGVGGGPTAAFWRSVDLGTRAVVEIARRSDGRLFLPIAWNRGAGELATAIETGEGGFASAYYVWRPGAQAQRSDMPGAPQHLMSAGSVQASTDGRRVLGVARGSQAVNEHTVFVWPTEAPERAVALRPKEGDTLGAAAFRPGSDELGVSSGPLTVGAPGVMRFEIWTPAGQRRVVRDSGGLRSFRVDGSAAVTADNNIVDIATGRATPIPSLGQQERVLFAVVLR